jgi:hypothetical protein
MVVPVLAVAAGAVVGVLLASSSNSGDKSGGPAHTTTVDTAAQAAQEKYEKCKRQTAPLMQRLHELDSRLGVGLNYDEYTNKVGDVRVAYDQTTSAIGGPECLSGVGLPAEDALNEYVKASNTWGDCVDDINCDNDSIQPELQGHWAKASLAIDRADRGLRKIRGSGS